MATAEEIGDGLEFLSDPVDRFPLPDLEATDFDQDGETDTILTQSATDSSMGDVRDPTPTVQLAINNTCDALTLSAANSQCSAKEEGDEAPGWAKRVRVGRAPIERPPCAGRVSALEKSLRGYAEKKTETVVVPAVGNNFDSLGEAYDYYNLYYWEIGFGIRYGKSRLNVERTKCMQEIVCGCSGKPKKGNTRTCRCECPAMIRLLRSNDSGWYICEHRPSHNHVLTAKCGENLYWPSHKHIDIYTRDLVKQLRENNISIGKVYNIIGSFFGSMSNVPFSKRALRGLCGEISCWHICYHPLLLAPRHQDHLPKSFLIKALYARDHRMLHVENPKINVVQHENLLTSQTNKNQTVFFVMLSSTVALAVPERTDGNQKDELFAPCSHTQTATSSQLPSDNQQRIRTN